jgi:hypothetical protein
LTGLTEVISSVLKTKVPRLVIPQRLWQKLLYLVTAVETEVSGFGSVETSGPDWLVKDIFLLSDEVSPKTAVIDAETIGKFLHEYIQRGNDPDQLRLHWHSHGNFGVGWSDVDEQTIEELIGMGNTLASLVINRSGDHLCRLDVRSPQRIRQKLPLFLVLDPPLADTCVQWRCELKQKLEITEQHQHRTRGGLPGVDCHADSR